MIPRFIQQNVVTALSELKKVVVIVGPRQAGKTTLLKSLKGIFESNDKKVTYLNCDLSEDLEKIDTNSLNLLSHLVQGTDYLFIDEAQRMDNPGLTLKIIHDNFSKVRVIATGSSSFEIKNKISDSLTGRYVDFHLLPLSLTEISTYENSTAPQSLTSDLMLYGGYPEIYLQKQPNLRQILLEKITQSYLFKDILAFSRIRHSEALINLARALAYQIGSELNENELANRLKIDRKTVLSYLDILEQSFVIHRLYPYSQNPRREIGRRYKIYFVDLGIRNSLIGDFNSLNIRGDTGALWENFLIMERRKSLHSSSELPPQTYFWRSYNGSEVDYLEINGGVISPWEFKYNSSTSLSTGAKVFEKSYHTKIKRVDSKNYLDSFLTSYTKISD